MNFHLFSKNENFFKKFDKFLKKNLIIHDNYNLKKYHKKINYRVLFFKNFIFVNNNFLIKIKLLLFLFYYSFLSLIFLLFGKVSRSFLLDDKIKTIYLNENKFKKINLFFNNSTLIHRHLWTYPEFHKLKFICVLLFIQRTSIIDYRKRGKNSFSRIYTFL